MAAGMGVPSGGMIDSMHPLFWACPRSSCLLQRIILTTGRLAPAWQRSRLPQRRRNGGSRRGRRVASANVQRLFAPTIGLSALRMRRAKSAARTSSSAGPTCAHTTSSVRTDDGSERGEVGLERRGSAGPVRAAGVACGGRALPERGFKMHGS